MKASSERRHFPRVAGRFPVRYRIIPVLESGYSEGRVEDLSPEGLRFVCPSGVRARSGLLFEMLIPEAQPVRSFARAAWVRELPGSGGLEVGSRFVDQSTATRKAIERHLQRDTVPSGR